MIHPLSDCMNNNVPESTKVWQFCVIFPNCSIGENCNFNANVLVENDVVIGNNVTIKSGVQIWDGITIEDDVFVGPNVSFVNNPYVRSKHYIEPIKSLLKKGCSIGSNATILCGVTVGEYSFVGAGAVLTKSTESNTLWIGNPAKQVGFVTNEGLPLDMNKRDKNGIKHEI
jgi:UDP-2-acetamido-3-amino-2,3-dideoxy-glucuronate N-acetyltransferase